MDLSKLRQEAEAGNVGAQSILGISYLYGYEGVDVDYAEAFRLLSAAAQQGVPRAILNLARMYLHGSGISKDVNEAVRLFNLVRRSPADEFEAQLELARIYSRGLTGVVDSNKAARAYSAVLVHEPAIGDCEEIREAKAYLARPGG